MTNWKLVMVRKPMVLFGLMFILGSVFAQSQDDSWALVAGQPVKVNELVHQFGPVMQGAKTEYKFVLENTGTDPLVIKHVTTSCGCTSPDWDKKPVKSGKTATVKVKYDSSNTGSFTKSVFVYTNLADKPITLQITGEVQPRIKADQKSKNGFSKQTTNLSNTQSE